MEQLVKWIAVGYDGNENVLLEFQTTGEHARDKREVLSALMTAHPEVQAEITAVCAIIEAAPGSTQQPLMSISHDGDTLWHASIV